MRSFTSGAFLACALSLAAPARAADGDFRWVQHTANGVEMRAATLDRACPAAQIDGRPATLKVRSAPGPGFPVMICVANLPPGAKSAMIGGAGLPLPKPRPDRILLIGDTGCRLSFPLFQACNNPTEWPFPNGAEAAAATRPDLVIHLGDFHYREQACPLGDRGCQGTAFGDNWDVWRADFFDPARPLLETAPWVMVRGNHEECQRGGKGWSRALDPYDGVSPSGCLQAGAPFAVDLGGVTLVALDTATAAELRVRPEQSTRYRKDFADVARLAPQGPVWLAFHRPIWAVAANLMGVAIGGNATLADAHGAIPRNVEAILSGHVHTFQIMDFEVDLPVQVIVGHGGDQLHRTASDNPSGLTVKGAKIRTGRGTSGVFGYAMLERRDGGDWTLTNMDFTGKLLLTCDLAGRRIDCR